MAIPDNFLKNMFELMNESEYRLFAESLKRDNFTGLRINTLKVEKQNCLQMLPFSTEPVPWCTDGYYYDPVCKPGKHPLYHAGLYYIQEPSAMYPAQLLDARPGEKVLDLCAAPGGKTVQIAALMRGKGLIVSNDNSRRRAKALVRNIELCGIRNAVVTVEDYRVLAGRFNSFFDRILVDAPCSGEGMLRKNDRAAASWTRYGREKYADLQFEMLCRADTMLKPGGRMVYSTCTFSPLENECVIARFLSETGKYQMLDAPKTDGIESGRPAWCGEADTLKKASRLWPHRLKGEGHFAAMLLKTGGTSKTAVKTKKEVCEKPAEFKEFEKKNLNTQIEGNYLWAGKGLYLVPEDLPDLDGIRVAKFGWYLGQRDREKFKQSHSLAMSLKKKDILLTEDFDADSEETARYLRGETLFGKEPQGLTAVCVNGFPMGWATRQGDILKNLYPPGWRMQS